MLRHRQLIVTLAIAAPAFLGLTACGDDPTSPQYDSIVGDWDGELEVVASSYPDTLHYTAALSVSRQDGGSFSGDLVYEDRPSSSMTGTISTAGVIILRHTEPIFSECVGFEGNDYYEGVLLGDWMALEWDYVCSGVSYEVDLVLSR